MKKLIGYICGIAAVLAGAYAVICLINRKRFQEQTFTEDDPDEDIFEDDPEINNENPVYVSDRSGDGNVDTFMMDTTGDGKIDTVLLDTTGDGEVDTVLTDTTGDGELDTIYTDFN
ncbi:MAG: hypothetical protein J6S79_06450 [Lachnospiraceae bacterium]|jgi:hypothetical protein|nr:hypothetical protein [Lachnospiraceae bacterium]